MSENSAHDNLSIRDIKSTGELIADFLRPNGHAIFFCTAQQFAFWHTLFCKYKSTQNDGSSSTPASTSRDTFTLSAAAFPLVDSPSHYRTNPAGNSCALATAVKLALHVKKNGLPLAAEEKTVDYKQLGFVKSAFLADKTNTGDVRGAEPGEGVMLAATESREVGAAKRLRPEQRSNSPLWALVSHFSQPMNLDVDLLAETFSAAVFCFTVPHHRVFVGCGADPKCFRVAKNRDGTVCKSCSRC